MSNIDSETIHVTETGDIVLAGQQTKAVVSQLEFDESVVEEIVLVVHELASNIVKHAGEGSVHLVPRSDDDRSGIEIRAEDSGPGIGDVEQALADGYSTVGSLGGGLGTVHRLMDKVMIDSDGTTDSGVQIVATRWSERSPDRVLESPLAVGAATRAKPGEEQNGDAFLIEHDGSRTLVGVIDGLGHGENAHQASRRARQFIETHSDRPLPELFEGVERTCRSTRGVVMALASFDLDAEVATIGSVGNISVNVCNTPESIHAVSPRGVVGGNAPNPILKQCEWQSNYVLVLHSDGLTNRWSWDDFTELKTTPVTHTAQELLRSLSTEDDDATVLVVKEDR